MTKGLERLTDMLLEYSLCPSKVVSTASRLANVIVTFADSQCVCDERCGFHIVVLSDTSMDF